MFTARLFLSSTFNDFTAERDILHKSVFPRLEKLCQENGCSFHVVDLRWGVSAEDGNDYSTLDICLNEVKRCQLMTPRPNFIFLAGDRYGWRPLPTRLPGDLAERILESATESERTILMEAYAFDDNAIPREFRLVNPDESTVMAALVAAADRLGLSAGEQALISASATHRELMERMALQELPGSAVCAIRTLANVPPSDWDTYCDMTPAGQLDLDAWNRVFDLKDAVRRIIPDAIEYTLDLAAPPESQQAALEEFAEAVYVRLEAYLTAEFERAKEEIEVEEDNLHREHATQMHALFTSREKEAGEIMGLLFPPGGSDGAASRSPDCIVVVGEEGCGKTYLMAELAWRIEARGGNPPIVRFAGLTGNSTDSDKLLAGLPSALDGTPLLIDGVEHMNKPKHLVSQLFSSPRRAPAVLSMTPACFKACEGRLPKDARCITLDAITVKQAADMAGALFSHLSRTATLEQATAVLEGFRRTEDAHYLAILAGQAAKLPSYSGTADLTRHASRRDYIAQTLDDLTHRQHFGTEIAHRMVGYLSASRAGLSDKELFEVLSRDDAVWDEFERTSFHAVPDRENGLPYAYFSRVFHALLPLLAERWSEGEIVYRFSSQLAEDIARDYCSVLDLEECHSAIADYFQSQETEFLKNFLVTMLNKLISKDGSAPKSRLAYELPYQLLASRRYDDLFELLSDRTFLSFMHTWGFEEYVSYWARLEESSSHTPAEGFADLIEEATRVSEEGGALSDSAASYIMCVSDLLIARGGNADALDKLSRAQISTAGKDSVEGIQSRYHQIQSLLDQGNYAEALAQSEEFYREAPKERSASYCNVLYAYGQALYRTGAYQEAEAVFREYYELACGLGDSQHSFISLKWIASCAKVQGRMGEAMEIYEKLEDEHGEDGNLSDIIPIYFEAASIGFLESGDFSRSKKYFDRCEQLCKKLGVRSWLSQIYNTELDVCSVARQFQTTLEVFPKFVEAHIANNPGAALPSLRFENYVQAVHWLSREGSPPLPGRTDLLDIIETYPFLERCGNVNAESIGSCGVACDTPELFLEARDRALSKMPDCLRAVIEQRPADAAFFVSKLIGAWADTFPTWDCAPAEEAVLALRRGEAELGAINTVKTHSHAIMLCMSRAYSVFDRVEDERGDDGTYSAYNFSLFYFNEQVLSFETLKCEASFNEYSYRVTTLNSELKKLNAELEERVRQKQKGESQVALDYAKRFQ